MSRRIVCPNCGGAPEQPPAPGGMVRCPYCQTMYQTPVVPVMAVIKVPATRNRLLGVWLLAAALGVMLLTGALVGLAIMLSNRQEERKGSSSPSGRLRDGSAAVRLSGGSTPEPEEGPSTAEFEFHRVKPGYKGSFFVLGFVKNTSKHAIAKPKLTVVLLDAAGREVQAAHGYCSEEVLEPGERVPVRVLVTNPPPHVGMRYEVATRKPLFTWKRAPGLRVVSHRERPSGMGSSWYAEGQVQNAGPTEARFVRVDILGYRNNRLISVDQTYVYEQRLQPGGTARFDCHLLLDEVPDRFEYLVSGQAKE